MTQTLLSTSLDDDKDARGSEACQSSWFPLHGVLIDHHALMGRQVIGGEHWLMLHKKSPHTRMTLLETLFGV